jgi:hypothetical protein
VLTALSMRFLRHFWLKRLAEYAVVAVNSKEKAFNAEALLAENARGMYSLLEIHIFMHIID